MVHVLQTMQNLIILRSCFAEDGKLKKCSKNYDHLVRNCGAFCGLKWRIWRAKIYLNYNKPLSAHKPVSAHKVF